MESITPELLQEVRFERARRGYRPEDVNDFLARVADGIAGLRARVGELEDALPEQQTRHLLEAARTVADEIVGQAQAQVDRITFEGNRWLVATAGDLVRMTDVCGQALEAIDAVRGELRLAREELVSYLARLSPEEASQALKVRAPEEARTDVRLAAVEAMGVGADEGEGEAGAPAERSDVGSTVGS